MRRDQDFGNCFEVLSDVLYVLGRTLTRGETIADSDLGSLSGQLVKLGMTRPIELAKRAA